MYIRTLFYSVCLGICFPFFFACEQERENTFPIYTYADSLDFINSPQIESRLSEGFSLSLWAPEKLLAAPVGLYVDGNGDMYVSETARRKSSDIDIRAHRDWMINDLSLTHIDSTRAFHLKKLATKLSAENTWQEDLNQDSLHDYRDLMVESERIRVLKDEDGDGKADVSHLFAEDFRDMLTGVAGGVLKDHENVYLTAAPDLWKLRDEDGDGDMDVKESLSHGYGIHIAFAGHDMSGLVKGPDGKIYWSIGDIGVNAKGVDGTEWPYPHEGAVMRINPDGTEFEVFAHGLRNPQEIAFDKYGNLISVDNDGDHKGEKERYVHILQGSDTGWRIHWQFGKYEEAQNAYKIWMDEKLYLPQFPGRPAYALPPLALAPNGPAGLAYNPGTAMNEDWEDYFFASYFTGSIANSKIEAFKLAPKGASFTIEQDTFVMKGIQSTGINFGPDGALYVADWLEGYAKKDIGRIWKLETEKKHALQAETKALIAQSFEKFSLEKLLSLLAHPDMRIRLEAQFECVRREERASLFDVLKNQQDQMARIHAIWGMGQIIRQVDDSAIELLPYLSDEDPEIRAQVAKIMGDAKYKSAGLELIKRLEDDAPRAQYFAAEALGKIGEAEAFEPLIKLLEETGEKDPHLRHGIVYALSQLSVEEKLGALANHESEAVRVGAVVALREMRSAQLAAFLGDNSWKVVNEVARAIHDDRSVPLALPALAESLNTSSVRTEAFLRRAINANLRIGGKAAAQSLSTFAQKKEIPERLRADAIWALAYWTEAPVLDRVEGIYRIPKQHPASDLSEAIVGLGAHAMKGGDEVKIAYLELIGRAKIVPERSLLFALLGNPAEQSSIRQAALRSIIRLKDPSSEEAIERSLADKKESLRKEAQRLINQLEIAGGKKFELLNKALTYGGVAEQQTIFKSLAKLKTKDAQDLIRAWMGKLEAGGLKNEVTLDVLMAAESQGNEQLSQQVAAYYKKLNELDDLGEFRVSMYGGNPRQGGRLFYVHPAAQCIRCHQLEGEAKLAGPNLKGIASLLDRQELLEALVLPSKRISPGYGKEGLPSAMIPMQTFLNKKELRDVVAFLNTLK
ncbi:MAG: PVC-type heme-binding CxxCH protein [Bacteroidota bacterium]